MRVLKLCAVGLLTVFALAVALVAPVSQTRGQENSAYPDCDAVRYLMDAEITPYDLGLGGGLIQPDGRQAGVFAADHYADTWSFNVLLPRNIGGFALPDVATLAFDQIDPALDLEFALFAGMSPLAPEMPAGESAAAGIYRPVQTGQIYTFRLARDGAHTLVVRRARLTEQSTGEYAFTASFPGGGGIFVENLRDNTTNRPLIEPPELAAGREIIPLEAAQVVIHPRVATSVGTYGGTASQVRYGPVAENYGIFINEWADRIALLGGDLAVTGHSPAGSPRIFYLQDYGYQVDMLDGDFANVVDANGTRFRLSWQAIRGVWITAECAGMKLVDGRTFTGVLDPAARDVTFQGDLEDFTIRLLGPGIEGRSIPHEMTLSWQGIEAGSELSLRDGVFQADLIGGRALELETTRVDLRREPVDDGRAPENTPLAIELRDRQASMLLDWVNIERLALVGERLDLAFLDDPRQVATRRAADLLRLEALDDVIQIVYQDVAEGIPGEQRLLLPRAEGYIELVTPAGLPEFDGRALPGQPGYAPRALNNLGGECYPINTLQPQANCPPNGHPNPANSNLWYAVTDHLARGGHIDLALTRSYNSGAATIDGPFGYGWTSLLLPDYNTAFDPATGSRPVHAGDDYRVGLDLTWAPRGLVTFSTGSGSRHVFVTGSNDYDGGQLTALTMPGWTLRRDNLRDRYWVLRQDNGLVFRFDRAGRLVSYGYPDRERVITVEYPRDLLDGPGALGASTPVILTDAAELRRLELYYNEDHRVSRSVLRDMTAFDTLDGIDLAVCDPSANCFETVYSYNDGFLTGVRYADGSTATYQYNEDGRLAAHDDPRAPISPEMTYTYGPGDELLIEVVEADGSARVWRHINRVRIDEDDALRLVTVADEYNNTRTYSYAWTPGALKATRESFTLLAETSPLENVTAFETLPVEYAWIDGLLERTRARLLDDELGRNSLVFEYNGAGHNITRIRSGVPGFRASYSYHEPHNAYLPDVLTFADDTTVTLAYDDLGLPLTMTDRHGGVYHHAWDALLRLSTRESASDLTATDYTYTEVGLVRTVTQRRFEDPADDWRTVEYRYDGLGRLIGVDDPLTGGYSARYDFVPGEDGQRYSQIVLTDAASAQTILTFDGAGRLVEERIEEPGSADFLRRTTYAYDSLGRISTVRRWLAGPAGEDTAPVPLTTRYTYTPVPVLPNYPGEISAAQRVINGYQISMTDSYGRTRRHTYDALDRIRQIEDETRAITRYDYLPDRMEGSANGLRIVQREILDNTLVSTTEYLFDLRWQLRSVAQDGVTFEIFLEGDTTRVQALRARLAGIIEQTWNAYQQGRPARTDIIRVAPTLSAGGTAPSLSLDAFYDFRGRPVQVTDATGARYQVWYCPLAGGGERVIYRQTRVTEENSDLTGDNAESLRTRCAQTEFDYAASYDAQGRLVRLDDPNGARTYAYEALPGRWLVQVTFTGSGSSDYTWELRYDGAGDLRSWRDENNILHSYHYDTLGRLLRVEVEDHPEASFTFAYNAADLLTSQLDDLGRGMLYAYDDLGRLTVRQDARTADATIYGYNTRGLLATVISPLGNTTTFQYDDPDDPHRLTGVIEPTGNVIQFAWDDEARRLTYTGPRGNQTGYEFDGFGALWRIDDALGRVHELRYDAAGKLTQWRQSQPQNGAPAGHLWLAYPEPGHLHVTTGDDAADWEQLFVFNVLGQLEQLAGGEIDLAYDALGRLAQLRTAERLWSLAYQPGEPVINYTDGFGEEARLYFDALRRLTASESEDALTTYRYQAGRGGEVNLLVGDGSGRVITYSPGDETSRPPTVILRGPGQRLTYVYSAEGLLTEITAETCMNPLSRVEFDPLSPDDCIRTQADEVWRTAQRFVYDAQGRPTRQIDEEQDIETFAYDDSGNLAIYQDAGDKTFNYTYDALNRLESIASPTGLRLFLDYDDLDQVSGICRGRVEDNGGYEDCVNNGGVLETYSYDGLGRLLAQSFPNSGGETTIRHFYAQGNPGPLAGWGVGDDPEVTITRALDGVGLVESVTTDIESYGLAYHNLEQLAQVNSLNPLSYTYDARGRLESISMGDQRLVYEYAAGGRGYRVYEETTGAQIGFVLDERGFLAQIEDGGGFDYFLSPDGRTLVVQFMRADGELVEIQLNQRGETQNIAYTGSNLFVDYVSDATGRVQRQSVIGLPGYFEAEAGGYIVVIGYDNDNRPLTVRVNDRESGQLLYLLTITYDAAGQRTTETRQYGDGTQIAIDYIYDDLNQLAQRRLSRNRAAEAALNSSPFLLLLAGLTWLVRASPRRRTAFLILASGLLVALAFSLTTAQQVNGVIYNYNYDNRGNLTRIGIEGHEGACARYAYDSANRLIRATMGDFQQFYTYDAYQRLASIGEKRLIYHGSSHTLLATIDDEGVPHYHGQTRSLPEWFRQAGDETVWLLNDGRKDILAALIAGDETGPVWLFDPLGRFLSLMPPSLEADPCRELAIPPSLAALSPLQTLQEDMVWDGSTNLYFAGGRAYAPELGRYLQRDPLGPDALGNVYSYPARQTTPPVRSRLSGYFDGLYRLREALLTTGGVEDLRAETIRAAYGPAGVWEADPLAAHLAGIAAQSQQQLARQFDLPLWLATNYNLPGAYIDERGALRMDRVHAPGQGGLKRAIPAVGAVFDLNLNPLPEVESSLSRLDRLNALAAPVAPGLTVYEPFAWQPAPPDVRVRHVVDLPPLDTAQTPGAVLDWLPLDRRMPETGTRVLDVLSILAELPERSGQDWIELALDSSLPSLPVMPPASGEEWMARWFTEDIFGVAGMLRSRWPELPGINAPVYQLGPNPDWRLPER
jgi:YD repeat-containing protein